MVELEDDDSEQEFQKEYRQGGYHIVAHGDVYNSRYRVIRKLGWGYFSTVWLCYDERTTEYVALKIVKSGKTCQETALDEIKILQQVDDCRSSKRIVNLLDTFTITGPHGRHVCLVFELLGQSVLDLITKSNYQGIPLQNVKTIIKQVLEGLDYLHTKYQIIHTDLKPENILLQAEPERVLQLVQEVEILKQKQGSLPPALVCNLPKTDSKRKHIKYSSHNKTHKKHRIKHDKREPRHRHKTHQKQKHKRKYDKRKRSDHRAKGKRHQSDSDNSLNAELSAVNVTRQQEVLSQKKSKEKEIQSCFSLQSDHTESAVLDTDLQKKVQVPHKIQKQFKEGKYGYLEDKLKDMIQENKHSHYDKNMGRKNDHPNTEHFSHHDICKQQQQKTAGTDISKEFTESEIVLELQPSNQDKEQHIKKHAMGKNSYKKVGSSTPDKSTKKNKNKSKDKKCEKKFTSRAELNRETNPNSNKTTAGLEPEHKAGGRQISLLNRLVASCFSLKSTRSCASSDDNCQTMEQQVQGGAKGELENSHDNS